MATDDVTLDALRQRVTDIDRQLISLVAERKRVSGEVARVKRATGYPTRDFEREPRAPIHPTSQQARRASIAPTFNCQSIAGLRSLLNRSCTAAQTRSQNSG